MKSKAHIFLAVLALLAVVYVLDGVDIPAQSRVMRELTNAGHAPLFGVLSIAMLILSRSILVKIKKPVQHYVIAGVASLLIGVATEVGQILTPRDASLLDMLYNTVGIVSFLACWVTFDGKMRGYVVLESPTKRNLIRLTSILIFATAFLSFGTVALAHAHRRAQFPMICDFDSVWDKSFVLGSHAVIEFQAPPDKWSSNLSNGVCFWKTEPDQLSAVTIQYPYPIWTGYGSLVIEIFSQLSSQTTVSLRVNDVRHNFELSDRYNTELVVTPGPNRFSIPIADIENAPTDRLMDLTSIASIIIFAPPSRSSQTLFLDNIGLE